MYGWAQLGDMLEWSSIVKWWIEAGARYELGHGCAPVLLGATPTARVGCSACSLRRQVVEQSQGQALRADRPALAGDGRSYRRASSVRLG